MKLDAGRHHVVVTGMGMPPARQEEVEKALAELPNTIVHFDSAEPPERSPNRALIPTHTRRIHAISISPDPGSSCRGAAATASYYRSSSGYEQRAICASALLVGTRPGICSCGGIGLARFRPQDVTWPAAAACRRHRIRSAATEGRFEAPAAGGAYSKFRRAQPQNCLLAEQCVEPCLKPLETWIN